MRTAVTLSAFWFLYLGGLGIFFPYYTLYLRENAGLSGTQVGLVIAVLPLAGMLAQPLWGQIADRTGARARVLVVVALGAAGGQALLPAAQGFAALLGVTLLLALFATAVVPQAVAVSLASLADPSARAFGRVRVWGTVGFLAWVVSFPRLLDALQQARGLQASEDVSEPGLALMFRVTAVLFAAAGIAALFVPRGGGEAVRARRGDWRALLRHRPVMTLLPLALLAYVALQGPMGIFPIFIRAQGGSMETVGNLWVLMLLLEIPLIWYSGATLARFGPRRLLAAGVLSGGLRWAVCGLAGSTALIYGVQVLHGVVVAGLVIGGPLYIEAAVPEQLRSTAQSLLAMVGVGLGGILSNTAAGWLLEHVGPAAPYTAGGIAGLTCGLLMLWLLPAPQRPGGSSPLPPLE